MVVQQDRTLLQSEKVPPGSVSVRNLKNNPGRPIQAYDDIYSELLGVGDNVGENYKGSLLALGAGPVESGLITLLFRIPSAPTKKRNIYTWCGAFSFEGFWPVFPIYHGRRVGRSGALATNAKNGWTLVNDGDQQRPWPPMGAGAQRRSQARESQNDYSVFIG
ncbi:hypothetical protein VTI74DRAFT_9395 [Chaetomium olivicolor]